MKLNLPMIILLSLVSFPAFAEDEAPPSSSQLGEFQSPKNCAQESTASAIAIGPQDAIAVPGLKSKSDTKDTGVAN